MKINGEELEGQVQEPGSRALQRCSPGSCHKEQPAAEAAEDGDKNPEQPLEIVATLRWQPVTTGGSRRSEATQKGDANGREPGTTGLRCQTHFEPAQGACGRTSCEQILH